MQRLLKILTLMAICMAAVFVGGTPAPAYAGTCTTPGCGGVVYNNSRSSIAVTNCWTSGGFLYGDTISCMRNGWNAYTYNAGTSITPFSGSDAFYHYYDVDGFRVYKGCRVWGQWSDGRTFAYNRQGYSTSMWVRITGTARATIYGQQCT
jgi:hypothetical protein